MHDEKDGRRRRNKYDLDFAGRIAHEREMDKEIAMVPPRTGGVIQVRLEYYYPGKVGVLLSSEGKRTVSQVSLKYGNPCKIGVLISR